MKFILAYGDSLTWGHDASAGLRRRHAFVDRWPSRLEAGLGGLARVIPEGLGGRTTCLDSHFAAADRNGARLLPTLLDTHWPLDLVIVMLGTNDLGPLHRLSALQAAFGIRRLIQIVRAQATIFGDPAPPVLIVAPPHIGHATDPDLDGQPGRDEARAQSLLLARHYRTIASETGAGFFDAAGVARPDPADGIHLDAANTAAIGDALVPVARAMLTEAPQGDGQPRQ